MAEREDEEKLIPILMVMRKGFNFKVQLNLDDNLIEDPSSHTTALESIFLQLMHNRPEFAEIVVVAATRYLDPAQYNKMFKKKTN